MILWKSQTLKNLLRTWKLWKIGLCRCPDRQQPFNTNVTQNKGALRCNCCFSVTLPEIRPGLLQTASHLLVQKQNEAAAMWVNTHVPVKYLMSQSVLKSGVLKDEILPVPNYCVCTDTEGSPAPQQSHRRRGLISTQPCSHTDTATGESSEHFWGILIVAIPSKHYGFPHMTQSCCVGLYLTREMHQSSKQPLWATVVSYILSSLPLAASSMDITPPEQSHLLLNYNKLISLLTSKQKFPVKSLNTKIQVLQISGFTSRLKFRKRKNGKIY